MAETELRIRTASMADLERVAEIESLCFPPSEGASRESLAARLRVYPDHFWVLEDGGTIVGFVNGLATDEPHLRDEMYDDASMHSEKGAWQMIFGVDTVPEYLRRGFAAMLLRHAIAAVRGQGRKGLVLTCKDRLVHYYAKFGFTDEGISGSTHGNVRWHEMRLSF